MSTHIVGSATFFVKEGYYTVAEIAAWMGVSIALVHDAVINGEIASTRGADGVPLIPVDFIELMVGGDENEGLNRKRTC